MKKIEAIVRPEKLEPLQEALLIKQVNGLTINQVLGCGKQYGFTEYVRGNTIIMNTLPKIEITLVVPDDRMEEIIDTIIEIAQTGKFGDGKIFVSDIVDCIRIRTKERGEKAL